VQIPETRYTRSGDVNIAYQVVGSGPLDLLWIPGNTQHVELVWEEPYRRAFLEQLAQRFRLITFDKRGSGLSDRVAGAPPLEVRMDDLRAVLDASGSSRAVVFAAGDSGQLALVFAATHPQRVTALALFATTARTTWAPDYPWALSRDDWLRWIDDTERRWPESLADHVRTASPGLGDDELKEFVRVLRLSVSPGSFASFWRLNLEVDVRDVLPSVRVPTLVMQRGDHPPVAAAEALAAAMPDARLVVLPGVGAIPPLGDTGAIMRELDAFVAEAGGRSVEPESVLATVLFTDLVGSTARAAELGDRAWREVLSRHHAAVRRELARFHGVEHDTAGDGFFASFDGPARAIRCACAIREALAPLDLEVRAGVHTGECELHDGKVAGIAVAIGARVSARAQAGEVLVSQTVRDLVAGSGIAFGERGSAELKGVPGEWRLYAVEDA
jgi:class 3 adenylate cyclase/pimeloyl-ACP methyl ester carboxylesterase